MMACTLNRDHEASVKIQSFIDPCTYWLIPNEEEPPSKKMDLVLTNRVRNMRMSAGNAEAFMPQEGQMVAVMDTTANLWQRGKVKMVYLPVNNDSNYRFGVFLVDYGTDVKVDQKNIHKLPNEELFNKKHHAMQFKLYGIMPCNKQVRSTHEGDFKLIAGIGKEWDPIALKFITEKSENATAIYIALKYVDEDVGETILGDLHFVINGRCISMTDDLCSNQFAIFNEPLFKNLMFSGSLKQMNVSKPKTTSNEMEMDSAKFSAAYNDPIAVSTSPVTSKGGKGFDLCNVESVETTERSWFVSSKQPVLIPGGMMVQSGPLKPRIPPQSRTARHDSRSPLVSTITSSTNQNIAPAPTRAPTSYPSTSRNNTSNPQSKSYSESYTAVQSIKEVKKESPTQVTSSKLPCNAPNSSSRYSCETESTRENIEVKSPDLVQQTLTGKSLETSVTPQLNPESPDFVQRIVSKRGQRIKAQLLSNANKSDASENDNANNSLEVVSLNSSVDTLNLSDTLTLSDTESSPSGLFSKIKTAFDKTEATDSNLGAKLLESPQSPKDESPSNNSSRTKNRFLRYSDGSNASALHCYRRRVCTITDITDAPLVLFHGVDVDGPETKSEQILVKEAVHFHQVIQRGLEKEQVKYLTRIQSAVCPALVRGENAIIVHPLRSGKTFAYMAPLLSSLLCKEKYSKLPAGKGPLAVVLCPSARSCELVGGAVSALLPPTRDTRDCITTLTVFAGQDKDHMVKLTNGCHLLITTPRSLLRLLSISSVTDLSRICHLVLDEANMLLDKFNVEIHNILEKCYRSKQNRERKGIYSNLQVVTASPTWCPKLKSMVQQLAPSPLICIGSYLEMAIYAKLQPIMMVLNTNDKHAQLTEILASNRGMVKTVIVCQTAVEVKEVLSFLKPLYPKILRVDEDMDNKDILDAIPRWRTHDVTSYPILICTDVVLPELKISDATCLIHYSLPAKKSQFSIRFLCLMKNIPNIYKAECSNCKVHIFIGDENDSQFPGVLAFMKRLGAMILPELEKASKVVLLENEHRKETVPLCNNLLSFGQCKKKYGCMLRHAIMDADKPIDFPEKGRVKLKFLHARTASHITARLLEHTDPNGVTHSLRSNYLKIMNRMRSHFANAKNKPLHGYPVLGDICAYKDEKDVFYRVEVNEITSYDTGKRPNNVHIQFIDIGKGLSCLIGKLYALPSSIKEIPPLAVNVFICRVEPPDLDDTWSVDSCKKMDKWLREADEVEEEGPFIIGNIKMSLQNSLWLDPIQGRQCVPDLDCKSGLILKDFRQLMLHEKLAVDNPEHLTKLYAICKESGISIPDYTTKPGSTKARNDPSKHLPDPQWAFIPDEDFTEVFFTSAHNPGEFFVCICKFVSNMKKLTNEIQKYVAEYKPIEDDLIIHTGVVCLGRFPDDGLWYRAQVLSVTEDGRVELFFVDHGDSAFVNASTDIIPIQPKLIITLPFQAIECSLAGIEAIGGGSWSEEATDELYELTVNLKTDYRKPMYLTACSKEQASCTDGHKYNILLACKDDDEKNIVVVNEVFLKSEFAQVSKNGIESDALSQLRKNVEEFHVLSEAKDDDLLGDNDPESHPEPVCKNSKISSDATECEDIEPNSGAIVPATKPNSWIADEVYNGFGDFDFEFGDSEDTNPAETFIRDFLKLGPKEDSSRGECASNQCLPPKQHNVSIVEVPNTDSCLPIVRQNVESATTADIQESPGATAMSNTPNVIWYQDQIYVTMSVEIPNIDDQHYHLQVGKSTVAFTTEVDEKTYSFNLQLYGTVNLCEHASTGRTIRIKIKKIVPGNWPRLQKQRKNFWWLRYNIDYEDNTGEDYVRINPIGQLPIVHQQRDVRMDLQEEESEDSDFEEDEREFEPRDPFNPLN